MYVNLYEITYDFLRQIPRGKVSTYGALARALGDIKASRAVGMMLHVNPYDDAPCYRVVHTDGRIGGYATGVEKKIHLLKKDGIKIVNGRINLANYLFDAFDTEFPLTQLREEQNQLKKKVVTHDVIENGTVAGCDVSYGRKAYGAYVEYDEKGKLVKEKIVSSPITFPYIPTYLAYAEFPVLKKLLVANRPGILMVDGNGILHPRKFGLACHIGVKFELTTIGVAKSHLCGIEKNNNLFLNGELAAKRLGKLYISPGHKISVASAFATTKRFLQYRSPEPVRQAHILANRERKQNEH